jgi:predicted aspartyl protease
MKSKFYTTNGCPVVSGLAAGPSAKKFVETLVDTGASYSSLNSKILSELGVEINEESSIVVSVTSVVELKTAAVNNFDSLGISQKYMNVVVLDFPEGAVKIDGVLGVDFFQNTKLIIDFKKHTIEVKA